MHLRPLQEVCRGMLVLKAVVLKAADKLGLVPVIASHAHAL